MTNRRVILSGCSGGGKSTVLAEMAQRGYATVPEPGRRIVMTERATSGQVLPWLDMRAFCTRVIEVAIADMAAAPDGLVLFDRSALDALIWFDRTGNELDRTLRERALNLGYDRTILMFPPWPEIYQQDAERKHGLPEVLAEYEALCDRLPELGFQTVAVPRMSVSDRADWLEAQLVKGWQA